MGKIGDKARELARKAKELADRLAREAREAKARADQKAKDLANAISEKAKADARKALEQAKILADKAKKDAQNAVNQAKTANKNVKKKLKDLKGKVRSAYKKLLRKRMLAGAYVLIRANASGIATRLYPAIASATDVKNRRIKASFVPKSKATYNQVLAKWKSLGGKESKLNEAIINGAKFAILKPSSSLYPKSTSIPTNSIKNQGSIATKLPPKKSSFDSDVQSYALPFPNNNGGAYNFVQNSENKPVINGKQKDIFEFLYGDAFGQYIPSGETQIFSGCCGGMSSADGTDDFSTEQLTAEEQAELDAYDVEDVEETEKKGALRRFVAWIRSLFRKNKADESPYEDGSASDVSFEADLVNDAQFAPELTEEDLAFLNSIDSTYSDPQDTGASDVNVKESDEEDEEDDSSDDIWGIPKPWFWTGVVVVSVGAIWGGIKIYQHFKKK